MPKSSVKYEIHVNGYSVGNGFTERVLRSGFFNDPFLQGIPGTYHTAPNHMTFIAYDNVQERNRAWLHALMAIKEDAEFRGYIESETLPFGIYSRKFAESGFKGSARFPLRRCKTVELPPGRHKSSDMHVKRSLGLPRDELDDILLQHSFYEVHTPRNRIFTLQTEYFQDAKIAYSHLVEYFEKVGGVKQVDLEITGMLFRKPEDFPVARVVPKGALS